MGTATTATRLYDLLLPKIGSEAAECLTDYIDNKTRKEMDRHLAGLATKEDLFNLRQDFFNFWERGRGELDGRKEELRIEMSSLKKELHSEMNSLKDELFGRMSGLEEKLRGEMNGLREELRGEMNDFGKDLRGEMNDLREEVRKDIGTLRAEMQTFKVEIEKGFRHQFWLIVVLFLPLYLTLAAVAF